MFKGDRIRIRGTLLEEMIARNCTQPKRPQNSDYFKDKMLVMQAQEMMIYPTFQSIFMANLSSVESANPQAGPSNASILSEVAIYEQRAKFELTEREQRMDDQMRAQNPFYLRQAKKAQPALYDGDELLKPHHVPVIVSTSEEELELAEATRNKLHVKMNDSVCVEKRVNITPPNYSKENFMATFTPQTQLTPEQVFWSLDLAKRKAEELKAMQTPLHYQPPATNVILPITPAHRAMKAIYENLEAEVDQNETDLQSGEIERKNLLITNENLVAECLSKDVFYTATDSVLNVSRFSDMHDAFTSAQKRIADLESENFNLRNKIQNDDHDSMIKHFSKLEIQSRGNMIRELKEKISRLAKKNSDTDPIFDLKALVSQNTDLTAKLNALHDLNECFRAENAKVKQHYKELETSKCVTIPDCKPKVLAPGRYPIDVDPIPSRLKKNREVHLHYIKRLKENVETLREIVEKAQFIGTVQFRNDHFRAIMGYGDYVIGDSVISRVHYVKGLGHNLFSVGQFCDSDLEVAFRKHTCFVRDLDGVDLIKGSRGTNLYTIYVDDMIRSSPICLLSKASKNKSWLWHRRLNHLNFGTLNDLARKDIIRGLPRLKFEKDHLCSTCQLRKSRKATHKPKTINTIMEVLHTLHMDLCGPMRVQSINGKKYILVIVDDYSRFTWVKFLRSKDETHAFVINL
ncbi:retrovirus-related pol polyprotein from transposon TNT 1-94 [Tanacetum coccineum]